MQKRILALPGMGDLYWLFTKMESFIEHEQLAEPPLIYTWELQPHKRSRSKDYINRVPFVEYGGEYDSPTDASFDSLYFGKEWKIAPYKGFDYFLSMNGILRNGISLETGNLGKLKTNWFFELAPTQGSSTDYTKIFGRYILAYFTAGEMYNTWLKSLSLQQIYQLLSVIAKETSRIIVLTGSHWDTATAKQLLAMDVNNCLRDATGTTNIDQFFNLVEQADGMIGWAAGNTIMSARLRKPTLIIWSKYFTNEGFFRNCVPPQHEHKWHDIAVVERDSVNMITQKMITLIQQGQTNVN